ncbi:MAG: NAD(P)H-dependent glycerol-3-phosphate dehydrogenase [Prevotellaceae bacterium]|jgi:glycerol-3-phosphate dehydrogenase (NAD(P)+)|nr:NAD(P)H-dependent glycerol-3-phosphate dehydrogenase [Prevotellaceae bacterium]
MPFPKDLITNTHDIKFCVIGNGSWATALVKLLLSKLDNIGWYIRNDETIDFIKHHKHNPRYLTVTSFDVNKLRMSTDINEVIGGANVVILAIPSAFLLDAFKNFTGTDLSDKFIVSAIKGIIPLSNETISEYFHRQYNVPYSQIGVISGPCHAEEVAMERLSYLTFSCKRRQLAEVISRYFESDYLRVIASTDIYGVEYTTVLKNIYAIAAGICHGLGYGDNFMAVLVSNAFEEMKRFLNSSYFSLTRITAKSAYLGDLLVTSYSQFSRNRTFGGMIGKGYSVSAVQVEMNMVAEGYYATKCMHEINKKHNIAMPIADTVYRILYEDSPVKEEIQKLTEILV